MCACCRPVCPSQLTAPVLHKVLTYPAIQPLIHGAKGVGSQGDGTAQVLCKDAASQVQVRAVDVVRQVLSCTGCSVSACPLKRMHHAGFC